MKFTINIQKSHFYVLAVLLVLAVGVVTVTAFGTNNPAVFGHSGDEIQVTVGGQTKTLNAALSEAGVSGGSSSSVRFNADVYTGDGLERSITGVGFQPKVVMIIPMALEDNCDEWVIRMEGMTGTEAPDSQGQSEQGIVGLEADGFSVRNNNNGNGCNVNKPNKLYRWIAWTW